MPIHEHIYWYPIGKLLLDKDIAIRIVLFITILENKQKVPCLSR